ncbi:putative fatty acyl-CoA reductase CG5065 [Diabrotica virgifera virgifera]|uniref:Fatty acyl-CoA reductase n=1 Tax=Diabrotica virgifera virgifera TaxID=50390 RepID=A0A6P7FZB9_DIAVI|nr:putative fatty acyl-CoA reductase CG5065 [Diabrotica virgifera virgifera]XP_028141887.1 putative fatty acyl-CoA reductase CG5065 [Diabrotica virgifera virgifera]XP_028141888.1 putative fatty acyl-CoA reductase CG5065 [Diabrotica virgifera virgifera]
MVVTEIPDRIADTFHGRTIFITGVTGFIGKALLEKLLRNTNVKKIYVLIRTKKGKTPQERLEDIFKNILYSKLLSQNPDAPKKCIAISGDVSEVDLGISGSDRQLIVKEADFIFHSAATTRFDDTIKYAVTVNTRGTKYMLDLAEQCTKLKLFIHVSSSYAFPNNKVTMEKEYKTKASPHEVLSSLNWMDEDGINDKKILGDIPNSYTFSKALAENLVYEKVGKIPLIICRPAVVIPSFQDPIPGWANNLQGPMGLFVGAGKGVIRCMYMDSKSYANLIPVDAAVAGILVFSWYYLNVKGAPYIFNICVPETEFKENWETILKSAQEVIETDVPFNGILWYPGGTMTKSKTYAKINFFLFQLIPAIFIDLILFCLGYKPILYNIQMRINKGTEMFEFYTTRAWDFETKTIFAIREALNERELKTYFVKADNINLKKYFIEALLATRRNILKETDDMIPAAKRNMKIMFVLDRFVKIAFFVILGYFLYKWSFSLFGK